MAAVLTVAEVRRFFRSFRPRESAQDTFRGTLRLEMETHLVILRQRDNARSRPAHRSRATPDAAVTHPSAYAGLEFSRWCRSSAPAVPARIAQPCAHALPDRERTCCTSQLTQQRVQACSF